MTGSGRAGVSRRENDHARRDEPDGEKLETCLNQ
jgi:hypothetical protein